VAQDQFLHLYQSLPSDVSRRNFSLWLRDSILPDLISNSESAQNIARLLKGRECLNKISVHLRSSLPLEAVLPSEQISAPASESVTPASVFHLDAFLYDDEDEQRLVDEGKISRAVCKKCGSKDTEAITYVTHSCSRDRLEYIFTSLLPPLDGKRILDVGSRLGAVLYGAYVFSDAAQIAGIEINKARTLFRLLSLPRSILASATESLFLAPSSPPCLTSSPPPTWLSSTTSLTGSCQRRLRLRCGFFSIRTLVLAL
jgi:hypothetical protein